MNTLIDDDDRRPELRLGQVIDLSRDGQGVHVRVLVRDADLARQRQIGPGAHVYMVADAPAEPRELLHVLRVRAQADLPEPGTRLGQRVDRLIRARSADGSLTDDHLVLDCDLLGMFFIDARSAAVRFSGDLGQIGHATGYAVYVPSARMRHMFVNGTVNPAMRIRFGSLRYGEQLDYLDGPPTLAWVSMLDIRAKRTAMFGKTRLGKSNAVKLLVQGMLDATRDSHDVGQLILDVNGEYANTNPQDGDTAIASVYRDRCLVYFLTDKGAGGDARLLRFNFHERTDEALAILQELLPADVAESTYVRPLLSCRLPRLRRELGDNAEEAQRKLRKLMVFWTILASAGFDHDEERLRLALTGMGFAHPFNPVFQQPLRLAAYQAMQGMPAPAPPRGFREMVAEISCILHFSLKYPNDPNLRHGARDLLDADEQLMAAFLHPGTGPGPYVLRPAVAFHSPAADNFIDEILRALGQGRTVIVDLGSANERIIRYFGKTLSVAVFQQQEVRFARNEMRDHYVQIYFEEAHMIFPPNAGNTIDVYSRFAKEGAKFNIGIVYSTQSPSTINHDLLAQTENFFIGHLSSERDAQTLASVQFAFRNFEDEIMRTRTPGFLRMLTASHRYPIPVQAARYDGRSLLIAEGERDAALPTTTGATSAAPPPPSEPFIVHSPGEAHVSLA